MIWVLEFTSLSKSEGVIPPHSPSQLVRNASVNDRYALCGTILLDRCYTAALYEATRIVYVQWCVVYAVRESSYSNSPANCCSANLLRGVTFRRTAIAPVGDLKVTDWHLKTWQKEAYVHHPLLKSHHFIVINQLQLGQRAPPAAKTPPSCIYLCISAARTV